MPNKFDMGWQEEANCKNLNMDIFYDTIGRGQGFSSEAIDACSTCPVIDQCREYALNHELYGYWGGLTPIERKRIRKERGILLEVPESEFNKSMMGKMWGKPRQLKPRPECGTVAAYQSHRRYGEVACEPCALAIRIKNKETKRRQRMKELNG